MSHIRLIGLLLFITAITLALAAAATRTTHVQVSSQWLVQFHAQPFQAQRAPVGMDSFTTTPTNGSTPTGYPDVQQIPAGAQPLPAIGQPPMPAEHAHAHDWDYAAHQSHLDSTAIPIAWPLLGTGVVGLMLWFIQAPTELRPASKKRSSRRHRRR